MLINQIFYLDLGNVFIIIILKIASISDDKEGEKPELNTEKNEKHDVDEKAELNTVKNEKYDVNEKAETNTVRYCRKCGAQLLENSRFCRMCGVEVDIEYKSR